MTINNESVPIVTEYELQPQYDTRKSFYGKARVRLSRGIHRILTLISYNTEVAIIRDDTDVVVFGIYSPTTLRHIKEFLKQNGLRADTKKQILEDYSEKEKPRKVDKDTFVRELETDGYSFEEIHEYADNYFQNERTLEQNKYDFQRWRKW